MQTPELLGALEAILFVAGDAVPVSDLAEALQLTPLEMEAALDRLRADLDAHQRGIRLIRFGDSAQLATRAEYAPYLEAAFQPVRKQALSQAALETLAVIAYRQPVTRSDIERVRGVKCDYSLQSLLAKGLVHELGRKDTLGRPMLYGTTDTFLRHFGIAGLEELPRVDWSEPPEPPRT